jgi:hypothetical protein
VSVSPVGAVLAVVHVAQASREEPLGALEAHAVLELALERVAVRVPCQRRRWKRRRRSRRRRRRRKEEEEEEKEEGEGDRETGKESKLGDCAHMQRRKPSERT